MNIDKGNQEQGGTDAIVVGNVANGLTDCFNLVYAIKTLQNTQDAFTARTDKEERSGPLWGLILGLKERQLSTTRKLS